MTSEAIPAPVGGTCRGPCKIVSTPVGLIGVVITGHGDETILVLTSSRVSVAIFALGTAIAVDFAFERTGSGMNRACTPAIEWRDIVEVAVTDTTNSLAGVRRGNVVEIGIGGPEALPVAAVFMTARQAAARGAGRRVRGQLSVVDVTHRDKTVLALYRCGIRY